MIYIGIAVFWVLLGIVGYRISTRKNRKKISEPIEGQEEDCLKCPKCRGSQWIEGAGGGSFGNIECVKCKSRFNNLGIFGLEEIK